MKAVQASDSRESVSEESPRGQYHGHGVNTEASASLFTTTNPMETDHCYACAKTGIETEAGHFIGPKSSRPLLTDKRGRPLCDFHWWLMFESPWTRGGITWDEYIRKWKKPVFPEVTWPPKSLQTAELKKLKNKR